MVSNPFSNALKYRVPGRPPDVRLRCRAEGRYAVLSGRNNGLSLDLSQDSGKLFAMFQRPHNHVAGSGIGLYMVKKWSKTPAAASK